MGDIIASIRSVSALVAGIRLASAEQSTGVSSVGPSVSQVDYAPLQPLRWSTRAATAAVQRRRKRCSWSAGWVIEVTRRFLCARGGRDIRPQRSPGGTATRSTHEALEVDLPEQVVARLDVSEDVVFDSAGDHLPVEQVEAIQMAPNA